MGWLLERYRHMFALMGYHYPPHYMLIAEAGQVLFCSFAVGQRVALGVSGWQALIVAAAAVLGLAPTVALLFKMNRPLLPLLPAHYIGTVALFWLVPVHGDVAPLILVLGATTAAAVTTFRQSCVYVLLFATAAAVGTITGVAEQGWLIVLMVGFGGCVGQLLQQQLRAMEAEHREHERQQIVERAGIAGEVHDVVAHSLSIVLLNVTAARRSLEAGRGTGGGADAGDVDDALDALRDAEAQGREAMGDVRRTIELLRSDGSPDTPQPGLADIDGLVAGFRRAGSQIDWKFRLPGEKLSSATELAVYRVVQESLSNASRHAPGAAVAVEAGPSRAGGYTVQVSNPIGVGGRAGKVGSGLGIAGMTSRVENLGGGFSAGAVGNRWVVNARFGASTDEPAATCLIEEVIRGR
ncbi:putative two-component histidine kinase [Gordonia araii NBRC 100433]|uniref:histidine kinase n=1 Tax=Gordonia araii NBRC 100433 TaxID=1073574 RepID=G7GYX3_9ACTN|nr:histidine kinase [Gordonia araii]NNG97008.1 two-component sensor histidine kinase [Gordonia araii NBRC 100433]GAB08798.1 putative two-component histidine kinase [Gordonia araii NBRC 100433]